MIVLAAVTESVLRRAGRQNPPAKASGGTGWKFAVPLANSLVCLELRARLWKAAGLPKPDSRNSAVL